MTAHQFLRYVRSPDYGALAGLAVLEIIDWPIALAIGAGHALASNHNKVAQELGEALEDA